MADHEVRDPRSESARTISEVDRGWRRPGAWPQLNDFWLGWRSALAGTFEREVEQGRATLWLPVLFGAGILAYFGLPREPAFAALVLLVAAGAVIERGGSTGTRFKPRARASAWRITPTTPPDASPLWPNEMM